MASSLLESIPDNIVAAPRARRYAWVRWSVRLIVLAVIARVGVEAYRVIFGLNFQVTLPRRIYRGSQPTGADLRSMVDKYKIRTVINLRGCTSDAPWYQEEARTLQSLGISQEDLIFSAWRLPSHTEMRRLLEIHDNAEYPVFVHCWQGADRTGLATTTLMLLEPGSTLAEIDKNLTWRYGHFAYGRTGVLDEFFKLYTAWLEHSQLKHDPQTFRRWILEEYPSTWRTFQLEEITPLQEIIRPYARSALRVRLRNSSQQTWNFSRYANAGVHVNYQLLAAESNQTFFIDSAGLMDKDILPGESVEVLLMLPPLGAGRYRLMVDMVEENRVFFSQIGAIVYQKELQIDE